ncbi:MAG: NAD-dependent epimerase [Fimbriimonas sp.]
MAKILVTGAAGFIGMHVAQKLLDRGDEVIGYDNLNDYYEVSLKEARLRELQKNAGFTFMRGELENSMKLKKAFREVSSVVHLAAQAGVRYSLENPLSYINSNLVGFANILEACRHRNIEHLVYASSSSVYGGNTKMPFAETDNVDHPVSLYAATKKSNELMAHTYSHLFNLPTTGLRFFTVYGPWGRPDMAPFLFTRAILEGKPIKVFNHGQMKRDFTYVDDIATGVIATLDKVPQREGQTPPYAVYNIGNSEPVELMRFIEIMEQAWGRTAVKEMLPMQPGDVPATYADTSALEAATGFKPSTSLEEGIGKFVAWYRDFYKLA